MNMTQKRREPRVELNLIDVRVTSTALNMMKDLSMANLEHANAKVWEMHWEDMGVHMHHTKQYVTLTGTDKQLRAFMFDAMRLNSVRQLKTVFMLCLIIDSKTATIH